MNQRNVTPLLAGLLMMLGVANILVGGHYDRAAAAYSLACLLVVIQLAARR